MLSRVAKALLPHSYAANRPISRQSTIFARHSFYFEHMFRYELNLRSSEKRKNPIYVVRWSAKKSTTGRPSPLESSQLPISAQCGTSRKAVKSLPASPLLAEIPHLSRDHFDTRNRCSALSRLDCIPSIHIRKEDSPDRS